MAMVMVPSVSKTNKAATNSTSSAGDPLLTTQKQQRFGKRTDSEASLNSEISGRNVEICEVGEEMCAVPLELFEMSDLKKILCLDTWNFYLTEGERESLCAYLPNLDETAYGHTLRELFAGENFHFGSPITQLFHKLKGGLQHPHVARYKDGLKYLQRKHHYHTLRRYHNRMVNCFLEMKRLWQSHPHSSIEERIELWNAWKFQKSQSPDRKNLKSRRLAGRARTMRTMNAEEGLQAYLDEAEVAADTRVAKPYTKKEEKAKFTLSGNGVLNLEREQVLERKEEALDTVPSFKEKSEALVLNEAAECDVLGNDMPEKGVKKAVKSKRLQEFQEQEPLKNTNGRLKGMMRHMKNRIIGEEMQEISTMEKIQRDEEPRKTYRRRARIKEKSIIVDGKLGQEEEQHMQDTKVETKIDFAGEQKLDSMLEEDNIDVEPRKKYSRRMKSKDKKIEGEPAAAITAKLDENAAVFEENTDHPRTEDKVDSQHGKLPNKKGRKNFKGEENESPSSFGDAVSVCEKAMAGKALKKPPIVPADDALSLPFSVLHLLSAVRTAMVSAVEQATDTDSLAERASETLSHDCTFMMPSDVYYSQPIVQRLPSNSPLDIQVSQEERKTESSGIPFPEIVRRVQTNPGDPRILEMPEPLQGLVRGALRVLSSKTSPPGVKGWKPFVSYNKEARVWSWIGPLPPLPFINYVMLVDISAEAWGVSEKIMRKVQELFANWLKHAQDSLQQLGQLSLTPPPLMQPPHDEKGRFRELKAQRSLATINPSSDEMRAYFRKEEVIRYAVADRAFTYTTADGHKSVVAPIKRTGGKPNAKVRDHAMLKPDRPSHVTLLCLVRDAAARLPGAIGTRADVCALIRDSQYIVEDVSDTQLNQVVSGALDRLHYEKDPCVRFDGDRKLWVYLHTHRDEEDFEEDGTSSAKRWKRSKKDGIENLDLLLAQDYLCSGKDDQDLCNIGLDFSSPRCFEEPSDFSVYSTGRHEFVYNHQASTLGSPHVLANAFPGNIRDEGMLPFIDLPPSIQPVCLNVQQSHPMGWEVLGNSWDQAAHFNPANHLLKEDFGTSAVMPLYAVKPGQ